MSQTTELKRKGVRQYYDAQFKRAALEHYHQNGRNLSGSARALGVNHWTLRVWIDKERSGTVPAGAGRTVVELEAENRRLQKELAQMTEQRDILKKSLGILSTT